jgi:Na+-translocating ferredoxin:NAD+ oxidoreductase RNF subunit RnfB
MEKIVKGKAAMDDLAKLEELAFTVKSMSLCGLGKCSPNPVQSTLRYFRDEYIEHIKEHKCRAGVCRSLARFEVDAEACVGCQACKRVCPSRCIMGARRQTHEIIPELCVKCGACESACKFNAIVRR